MSTKGDLFHLIHIRENCQLALQCASSFSEDEFYRLLNMLAFDLGGALKI